MQAVSLIPDRRYHDAHISDKHVCPGIPGKTQRDTTTHEHTTQREQPWKKYCLSRRRKYGLAFFSSGMSAISTITQMLSAGDHVICCDDVYGGTFRLFDKVLKKFNLRFDFVDLTVPQALERYRKNTTKLVWLESPSNPLLEAYGYRSNCQYRKKAYYISRC